jgi:LCP family protein required for cell wall assembly
MTGAAVGRFATRCLIALLGTAAVVAAGVVAVNSAIEAELARIPRIDVATVPAPPAGANYLVVGSDSRAFVETPEERRAFGNPAVEAGRRSDTMMVVHVEPGTGRSLVVSFPRDLWVNVPGLGNTKINAAYNSDLGGGPDAVIEALRANFGIDVNHYVEVDFRTFESMVNAVGTVPVYVDRPMIDNFTGFVAVAAGCYQLNGTEALAWVRSRHLEYLDPTTGRLVADPRADIGRIERQQDFIRRLAGLVVERSLADPLTGRSIVRGVVGDLRVDRGFDRQAAFDLIQAFRSMRAGDTSAIEFVTFPYTEGNAGGQAVLFPDRTNGAPLLERLATFETGPAPAPLQPADVRVKVVNGSGRSGLADQVMNDLVAAGYVKGGTGNDERGRVAVTEVRYANGAEDKGRLVLGGVGAGAKLVGDPKLTGTDVQVVLGADFTGLPGAAPAGPAAGGAPGPAAPADPAADCR